MQNEIKKLQQEIDQIKVRNARVEADKAWERSEFRIFLLTVITYIVAAFVFYIIGSKNYLLNALIPTIGYFLSMQSLPFIKKWWIKKHL